MAVSAISSANAKSTQTSPPVASASKAQQAQASSKPQAPTTKPQAPATDTVKISTAAKALQELTETSTQTPKEAASGDTQAQRLLTKESAK